MLSMQTIEKGHLTLKKEYLSTIYHKSDVSLIGQAEVSHLVVQLEPPLYILQFYLFIIIIILFILVRRCHYLASVGPCATDKCKASSGTSHD